jgi:hypothetical protein
MTQPKAAFGELSVRTKSRGGEIFGGIDYLGDLGRLDERRIIIMVHGFNVDLQAARDTYGTFLDRLRAHVGQGRFKALGEFWGFYWPGDHPDPVTSARTFPDRIDTTKEAGRQLARLMIEYLKPHQEVFFIAHSLGCRVVLETLRAIAEREGDEANKSGRPTRLGAPVRGILLMAAAVPYQLCEEGVKKPFHPRDRERPKDWVIHSRCDWILHHLFPKGEEKHSGDKSEAVGRHGWPIGRWHSTLETDLGHSEYWGKSPLVLSTVPDMLEMRKVQELPERPTRIRCRKLPSFHLPKNILRSRNIGDPAESGWQTLLEQY